MERGPAPQGTVVMGTATQPLAVIAICWAVGLVACGCGQAAAGRGHFKDSLHLKLWHREGGGHLGLGVSRVPVIQQGPGWATGGPGGPWNGE